MSPVKCSREEVCSICRPGCGSLPAMFTHGNAGLDAAPFHHWLIGDLKQWSAKNGVVAPEAPLRQSAGVEVKWGLHAAGEQRAEWAPCSDRITLSLLGRGRFLLKFRSPAARSEVRELRFTKEGDYAIWDKDVEHTWIVEEESVIFTVRWLG